MDTDNIVFVLNGLINVGLMSSCCQKGLNLTSECSEVKFLCGGCQGATIPTSKTNLSDCCGELILNYFGSPLKPICNGCKKDCNEGVSRSGTPVKA